MSPQFPHATERMKVAPETRQVRKESRAMIVNHKLWSSARVQRSLMKPRPAWSEKEVNFEQMNTTTSLDSGRADSGRKRSFEEARGKSYRIVKITFERRRGARRARVGSLMERVLVAAMI
jgi:hypothetical protein